MNKQFLLLKTIITLLLAAIILTGTSCKKYLYEAPITATYGDAFWVSQSAVEQASVAMYGQLRSSFRGQASFFIFGDLASGAFLPAGQGQSFLGSITAANSKPFNFSNVSYYEGNLQNWTRFYRIIAQANLILLRVPKMKASAFANEAIRNSYIAEALFIRAYTYFYMIRVWGDPIYVTKTFDDIDYANIPPIARTPEGLVLDSCIIDLKKAAPFLSFTSGNLTKTIRANGGAVAALLAHIYAWKHDYANAHIYCQQVINQGGYTLEPMATYKNIWNGQSSNESIFELPMQYNGSDPNFSNQSDWAEAQFGFFDTFLKDSIVAQQNHNAWISPDGGLVDQFYDTVSTMADARYNAVWHHISASSGDVSGYMLLKYTNFKFQMPGSTPTNGTQPYINNNLVLFRLSDIILLDAEALASTGDIEGARSQLAQTEVRAGITSYQSPATAYDMLSEVLVERGRELFGEGTWYYDLIRTEASQQGLEYVGYPSSGGRLNLTNKGYYWPLDMGTLYPFDNLLTQNPWWAVHK